MRYTEKRKGANCIPLRNAVMGIDMPHWAVDKANDLERFLRGDAADKLAAYEDAEEQGLLVILPCKVGDTFYYFSETMHGELYVARSRVINIVLTGNAMVLIDTDGCYHYNYWLTREEAEAALKGERKADV